MLSLRSYSRDLPLLAWMSSMTVCRKARSVFKLLTHQLFNKCREYCLVAYIVTFYVCRWYYGQVAAHKIQYAATTDGQGR
ncbi:hypothetical protein BCR37DRAFT_378048 [Protomyces lactucae-debilis]|uniref:Uncharacterized protein n=1 Tax=Protomyces lactucae-debilis TaxID=2754530 RepID=A0A1Y2FM96_PROLT|nr:uncharacterized protein BCR37DRAFT_378048 [Protomyces lactucae-debilis]ORY85049.1 hypothetical protein BCR37DRAFT_378048 [Protomyces lactucae-debilis]